MQKSNSVARRIAIVWLIALGAFAGTMLLSIGLARCLARLSGSADPAAWVQAVGAIFAIVAGFATIISQRALEAADEDGARVANARAAHLVATHALTAVGERMDAVLAAEDAKHPYRLRGARTGEMIASLREFDTGRIPSDMLEKFLQLRANLYAMNERISDVYESEQASRASPRQRSERVGRLKPAITVWQNSRTLLAELAAALSAAGQKDLASSPDEFEFEKNIPPTGVIGQQSDILDTEKHRVP